MPIYEFQCQECGARFETIVPASSGGKPVKCRNCGSRKIKKQISAASFRVSGGSIPLARGSGGCSPKSKFR